MFIGNGWDLHKHTSSKPLIIGGLEFEEEEGFEAYSDGDILLHALSDALLGAVGKKDLGYYFPSKKPTEKGIASTEILKKILEIIEYDQYRVNNIEILISEKREKLEENISKLLNIEAEKINIKGKTSDFMGLVGDKKASSCLVTILLEHA